LSEAINAVLRQVGYWFDRLGPTWSPRWWCAFGKTATEKEAPAIAEQYKTHRRPRFSFRLADIDFDRRIRRLIGLVGVDGGMLSGDDSMTTLSAFYRSNRSAKSRSRSGRNRTSDDGGGVHTGESALRLYRRRRTHDKCFGKLILGLPLAQSIARLTQGGMSPAQNRGSGHGYACRGIRRLWRPYPVLDADGRSSRGSCHRAQFADAQALNPKQATAKIKLGR
jgi:hypothetical protein